MKLVEIHKARIFGYSLKLFYALCMMLLLLPSAIAEESKTKLNVLMYPWVPDYKYIADTIEKQFEGKYPNIDIIIAPQNWDYYKPNGLKAKYDIYELDTIFLADFVTNGRIQALDASKISSRYEEAFDFAKTASSYRNSVYGVPHWVCALYLFYFSHDQQMANAKTLQGLINAIGVKHERHRGLLVDMAGNYTLAEIYLDCLFDLGLKPEEIVESLQSKKINQKAVDVLSSIIALADPCNSREILKHDEWPPYYAHEFAHGRGRGLVGYSERMYHILKEIETPSDPTPVVWPQSISVRLCNQSNGASQPLAWVDAFVVDTHVSGEKLEAAYTFLNFIMDNDVYRRTLIPPDGPPLCLLPAYASIYFDSTLLTAAPWYSQFILGLDEAKSITGIELSTLLVSMGEALNKKLPKNLYPVE